MFKFNRPFFIITNFLISLLWFILVFSVRYIIILFQEVEKRPLSLHTLLFFTAYSLAIIIFNISLKVYEVNKMSRLTEAILANYFSSIISIGIFSLLFYLTQTDFARFVFFAGFLSLPLILSFFNKIVFLIISKTKKPISLLYFGSRENYTILNSLISHYQKWFTMSLDPVYITDPPQKLTSKLQLCDILIVDSDQIYSNNYENILHNHELAGGKIFSLIDIFSYFDQSMPAEIIRNNHYEFFSTYKLDSLYNKLIKRLGDIGISLFLIILLSPLMLLTAFIIKISSPGKIFYRQIRTGLYGKNFTIYKFRSMRNDAEKNGVQLTTQNDMRITLIGKIIRPLRIDEIPQLFNILKGDMSFIGPRPERPELIHEIIKEIPLFKKRLLVKPGLTGWAQVKFTYVNTISLMNTKLSYDLFYINNLSILLDFKILLYTLETIIFRRGAM